MDTINRIAILGECMIELKTVNGHIEQGFGGDTLNTAVYLSRLTQSQGKTISYLTGMGQDPFSANMLSAWKSEGVDIDHVDITPNKVPGIYVIETAEDGERSFYYWRNDSAAKYWIQGLQLSALVDRLCQFDLVYLSGISLAILTPESRTTLFEALAECKQKGLRVAFDNNYRPALWKKVVDAQKAYEQMLQLTDLAFLTFDDEVALWGDDDEMEAIARTRRHGVSEIVVKRGAESCYILHNGLFNLVPAEKVETVLDTTAAGDSFSAGYLANRVIGGDIQSSARLGHLVASKVIQHPGAIIPSECMPMMN
ncbi:sugar kinase [Photobacterium aphoticum]|uniref:2-dehydro-3-deoxygluconokinase n=1 Tax=Photobacterium aphoticum TaxID=754436 RepID=A0A0J1GGG0_9GAMM|nr:sugar kinase [Photobacterium aphoticum]KLU98593.1 ketodeoxygluconokinase [Photobacterium aphoticum]PSU57510.1 sugar kinase [Photobacterium aphoticum]GHA62491.1 2-dehydro-3-deoxygluconokinase [Photobacterium aphoticum]